MRLPCLCLRVLRLNLPLQKKVLLLSYRSGKSQRFKIFNARLVAHFADIKDPRVERTKKHQLTDILVISIFAIIARAQGWEDIENYGLSKKKWLEEFLALPYGIPSDDTFRRIFEFIDPEALNRCFGRWAETLVTKRAG